MKRGVILAAVCGLFLMSAGCGEDAANKSADNQDNSANKANSSSDNGSGGHSHGAGPHGGAVADAAGGKYHFEFTVDHPTQEATIYILGSDAKTAAPIKTDKMLLSINEPAFQVDLMAVPLDGETDGMCSRFVGKHESLGIIREFAGTISGTDDGTPVAADFKEEAGE